jgi:hypothetical protein
MIIDLDAIDARAQLNQAAIKSVLCRSVVIT